MDILPYVYLGYMFISIYFLTLFLSLYLKNRRDLYSYPNSFKKYSLSILVPAYNEEKTIGDTLKHIFQLNYPILEVIVINDNSSDRTLEIARELAKKHPNLKIINNVKNLGKAGGLNRALKISKGELIAVVDADSYPSKDSVRKMVGYFNDTSVGAVTCPIVARNNTRFFEKLQSIEYKVIALTRKFLDYVDAIYVTPGPLAIYRKSALDDINGFDEKNLTEDIEATWHLAKEGWNRRMCLDASVSSTVPTKFISWFKQRRRWNIGGLQCIYKYKSQLARENMLGWFIIPFFILNTFLGLLGLSIFIYLFVHKILSNFLFTFYSISVNSPILTLDSFYITPSILNYLGIVLFIVGLIFTLIVLSVLKENILRKENILNIPFYMIIYLAFYPLVMLSAIWHVITGKRIWR